MGYTIDTSRNRAVSVLLHRKIADACAGHGYKTVKGFVEDIASMKSPLLIIGTTFNSHSGSATYVSTHTGLSAPRSYGCAGPHSFIEGDVSYEWNHTPYTGHS